MRVLIVCTGNTCRSPLAQVIAQRLAGELGLDAEFESAGTHARDGDGATIQAIEVARERGDDLSRHHARRLTPELVDAADLILAMRNEHLDAVSAHGGAARARLLTSEGIPDPLPVGTIEVYRDTAAALEQALRRALLKLPSPA